jgi:hypothetical protein
MMKTAPTSPSLTSLFSSLTQTSAGSSGSSSTVTPASVSRARQRPSRHSVAVAKPSSRPRRPMAPVDEKPNVFAFMEDEEDQTAASGPASSSIPPAPSPHSPPGDYNHAWGEEAPAGSLCSDSGISVRSASPPPATAATYHKLASQPARRRKESRSASHSSDASRASDMGPEAFYALAPRPQRDHEGGHARGLARSRRRVAELDASRTGYDLVASTLSSQAPGALQPVYRTFETLNHRILLYLQDEISELEEGLRAVDAAIAQSEKAVGLVAASRRMEMKMPSQLQWQRMELVGRSMAKLDQYNRALCSYSELSRSLETASPDDVAAYRSWLANHTPIVRNETSFLEHLDLARTPSHGRRSLTTTEQSAMANAVVVLTTIVSFKLVPEICSRLVIGAIVTAGIVYSNSAAGVDGDRLHVYGKQAAIYGSAILILALTVG